MTAQPETTTEAKVHIRWMLRRDLDEVLAIENASFDFAWTEEDFLYCQRQRNCIGMVAESLMVGSKEKILGFMIYELHKKKLHALNFAVHPGWRHARVGSQMAAKLASKLHSHGRTKITLNVRESNLAAQLFFRSQGFRAVRVLPGFYEDSGEDAYRMAYRINE